MIKVIFHIDESEKWLTVISNVLNLCKGIDVENAEIEILANSKSVEVLKKTEEKYFHKLKNIHDLGIKICACKNSMNNLHLKSEDIYDFIEIVPIGILELIEKQQEGYAYIKP